MQFNKLYLSISLLLIGAMWVACVDVPSGPGTNPNPNFRSLARFVNLAPTKPAGSIIIDGVAAGPSMNYLGNSGYIDVASGSRSLSFGGPTALVQAFTSEQQSTVVIYEVGADVAYLNLAEGDAGKNNAVAGFAKVKFVNAANGAAANVIFRRNSATGTTLATSAFGAASQYLQRDPDASDTIFALSGGGYTTGGPGSIGSATSGSTGFGSVDFSVDGGLVMNLTVKSKNSEGFYSSANISDGGSVQYAIPVTAQTMTFRSITLSGAQEVPPVTTTATATATLSVRNDSSSTGGATYSVTTVTPTSSGFFTAAHIHNAPAGVNGPVVSTPFNVSKQTISFPSLTATGAQEVPPVSGLTARATLTFTLYRDSLQYSVRIFRDAVDTPFTAMHFHAAGAGSNGPVIKNIRTTPWSSDSLVVTGTWKTTDTTQALTAAIVDSIRLGRVYFNAHSVGRPAGIIRAQLVPNGTHTNTFAGTYTGSGFNTLKNQFAFSNMYFNFHTAANPGGEIRGQAIPDTFTTNAYTATATGVPNSVGDLLNAGSLSCNLVTPGGTITGRLAVDATRGQYAVASIANSAFDAAKMYTVIATGKGPTFQILKLEDRLFGVARPAIVPGPKATTRVVDPKTQAGE